MMNALPRNCAVVLGSCLLVLLLTQPPFSTSTHAANEEQLPRGRPFRLLANEVAENADRIDESEELMFMLVEEFVDLDARMSVVEVGLLDLEVRVLALEVPPDPPDPDRETGASGDEDGDDLHVALTIDVVENKVTIHVENLTDKDAAGDPVNGGVKKASYEVIGGSWLASGLLRVCRPTVVQVPQSGKYTVVVAVEWKDGTKTQDVIPIEL